MLREYLVEKSITFIERFVDDDEVAKEDMMKVTEEYLAVPFTYVVKDDNSIHKIIGFNKKQLEEVFG
jgi:hypothetical protein